MRLLLLQRIRRNDVMNIPRIFVRYRSAPASTNVDPIHLRSEKPPSPNFDDSKEAFGGKSMKELLRAYFVFNLCSVELLVKYQFSLLNWTRRLLGRRLFEGLMRSTIYGQFMAGDNRERVLQSARQHIQESVTPIFQYTAQETHGFGGADIFEDDIQRWEKNFLGLQDSLEIATILKQSSANTKVSGKLTCLTSTEVLKKATNMVKFYTHVMSCAVDDVTDKRQELLRDAVKDTLTSIKDNNPHDLVLPKVPFGKGTIDSFTTNMASHLALMNNKDVTQLTKGDTKSAQVAHLTEKEKYDLLKVVEWMQQLGQQANNGGVRLLVDAEQSYLQLTLDVVALDLKRLFNHSHAVVYNTYQCYRKRTFDIVQRDLKITENEKICFGAKIVRGAYIDEERKLAQEHGTEDPINETFDATTNMYHKVATLLLRHLVASNERKPEITFASHNIDTVKFLIQKMDELQVSHNTPHVGFAQLLGMRDYIAFPLGKAGFCAHKLLHYGPVEDAIAYISRRLAENKAGVATANMERHLLGKELRRRLNPLK